MAAREAILARIRANLGKAGSLPEEQESAPVLAYMQSHIHGPRPQSTWPDLAVRFAEKARALGSSVEEVAALNEVPSAVAHYLDALGLQKNGVCWPELAALPWAAAGMHAEARPATGDDLVGITGSFCAIAETGTLMLLSGESTPATTSLLPETHIAILQTARIVTGMEEAWVLLRKEQGRMPRAVNFVSGPSRTADIEQTIVIGAHGPYRVHIIVAHP